MSEPSIKCPNCGHRAELTKAVTEQVEERLRRQYDADVKRQRKAWEEEFDERLQEHKVKAERAATKKAKDAVGEELQELKEQMEEKTRKLQAANWQRSFTSTS